MHISVINRRIQICNFQIIQDSVEQVKVIIQDIGASLQLIGNNST